MLYRGCSVGEGLRAGGTSVRFKGRSARGEAILQVWGVMFGEQPIEISLDVGAELSIGPAAILHVPDRRRITPDYCELAIDAPRSVEIEILEADE